MNILKYILMIVLPVLGACSAEELCRIEPSPDSSMVQFSVSMAGEDGTAIGKSYFGDDDQIRICNPVGYSTPDFKDKSTTAYFYQYEKTEPQEDYPYKFMPAEGKSGFSWSVLSPTSIYYIFEAVHFPGGYYLSAVPDNQSTVKAFEEADMLIAHHRQLLSDRNKSVSLTFHHAFAMVQVKIKLPISDTPADGPFPAGAVRNVYMHNMLRGYEVNYSTVIDNDGLRTVRVSDEDDSSPANSEKRTDIPMWCASASMDETPGKNGIRYQRYTYQAIVPEQSFLDEGKDFLYFEVRRHDGGDQNVLYKFVPKEAKLSLKASHQLNLSLSIDAVTHEVVVLTAELVPWNKAEADMDILPEPTTE